MISNVFFVIWSKIIDFIQDVEAKNNQNLMEEYDKFQTEQERTNRLQEGWQTDMRRYEEDTQQELMNTQSAAESLLNVKTTEITKVRLILTAVKKARLTFFRM